jgi:hypothetical protein
MHVKRDGTPLFSIFASDIKINSNRRKHASGSPLRGIECSNNKRACLYNDKFLEIRKE